MNALRIGTRGSQLALYQANTVAALLRERTQTDCEIVIIKTSGDRLQDAALSEVGGKRLFVKEIEDALLAGTVDLAVHSSKDMPAVLPDGLDVAAVLPREDARDAIVLGRPQGVAPTRDIDDASVGAGPRARPAEARSIEEVIAHLGSSPRIGTSSVRRIAQLIRLFPGARFLPIRGNLDTRLRKLDEGQFDAIVLASAGLRRLGFGDRISAMVPVDACVPAPGQGIIAVETRASDERVRIIVERLNDATAKAAFDAERAVVRRLGGGCQMPIGAYASISGSEMRMSAVVISLDGSRAVRAGVTGAAAAAESVGVDAAERLLAQGAADILADVGRAHASVQGLQP